VVTGVEMFKKQLDEVWRVTTLGCAAWHWQRGCGARDVLAKSDVDQPKPEVQAEVYILTKEEGGRHTASSRATVRSF